MFLPATRLTSKITIEVSTVTNTDGVPTERWAVLQRNVPAEIIASRSSTVDQAARVSGQTLHQVTIRYRDDIDGRCRFKIGDRVLHILGPPRRMPETRPTALVMECVEVEA